MKNLNLSFEEFRQVIKDFAIYVSLSNVGKAEKNDAVFEIYSKKAYKEAETIELQNIRTLDEKYFPNEIIEALINSESNDYLLHLQNKYSIK